MASTAIERVRNIGISAHIDSGKTTLSERILYYARKIHKLEEKLRHNTITTQLPIGEEADFEGIIDLVKMKAYYFDGDNGEDVREEEIPAARVEEAKTARHDMIASIADHDDAIADKFLAEQ